jgi:hypothetical protein
MAVKLGHKKEKDFVNQSNYLAIWFKKKACLKCIF